MAIIDHKQTRSAIVCQILGNNMKHHKNRKALAISIHQLCKSRLNNKKDSSYQTNHQYKFSRNKCRANNNLENNHL